MISLAKDLAAALERDGYSAAVINPRFIKPLDREMLARYASRVAAFVTFEDHVKMGGFGSAVVEALEEMGLSVPVVRIGWPDQFIEHGKVDALRARYGLTVRGRARAGSSAAHTPAPPHARRFLDNAQDIGMFDEVELEKAGKYFAIVGPQVSEADINTIFPTSFPSKDDLVQFYLRYNGGSRSPQGCVIFCGNPAHKTSREALDKLNVEAFSSVSLNPNDRMLPFSPILRHHAAMLELYAKTPSMKEFYEQHLPFAFGHSGEDLCINLMNGSIWYMDYTEYQNGAIEISSTFRDFILNYWNNAEPRVTGH